MITLIEALNFRCLRYIRQPLAPFHVLVGPNASGKTTFFDIIAFLGRMVSDGLDAAVAERSRDFKDLIWNREGTEGRGLELAVEAKIPAERLALIGHKKFDTIRYEVSSKISPASESYLRFNERVILKKSAPGVNSSNTGKRTPGEIFPRQEMGIPKTIFPTGDSKAAQHIIFDRSSGGSVKYIPEIVEGFTGSQLAFKLNTQESALGNLPEDESKFPASTWLKRFLIKGIQPVILNSLEMREPAPSGQGQDFKTDGSNLPWLIHDLRKQHKEDFKDWLAHIKTALLDIEDIKTVVNSKNGNRHILFCYKNGLEVPSWTVSDGTLRLLALTILAYIPGLTGIYLIEEPENGLHPQALETVYQSLSSVYDAQILLATHSSLILSMVKPGDVLCFAKTSLGETDIVRGPEHPHLVNWKKGIDLGTLFAGGVLDEG